MALVLAVAAGVVLGLAVRPVTTISVTDSLVVTLICYLAAYVVITAITFSQATDSNLEQWADREERGNFVERYVLGTAPGPGISIGAAALALVVATVWLPGNGNSGLSHGWRALIAVVLLVVSWSTVVCSYSVTFMADNIVDRGASLDFPDDSNPGWSDYIYFAFAVMTTFGATDVTVTSKAMRRTVTVAATIAFVFNTVIVAAAVSALMG
ncbi:Uncharacterized membrane protein [Williamsia sterculiae]|uniref:Uncharacterized membrane protein n=1 Tax=Williamsia sterculiae TaxID=1344003 RepID=A0A1N7H1U1_9NOCA|nr:Uncharacterized membrane protein [Williamsia sterculiae]